MIMTYELARAVTGGLSAPSKMPCPSYSLPATACKRGAVLHEIPGTVCSQCYALKGRYRFSNVKSVLDSRLQLLDHPLWVEAMVYLIIHHDHLHFRWHDSGDLQSLKHLLRICEVAVRLPHVKFWLPTRETTLLAEFFDAGHTVPDNLIIRISASKIDGRASTLWSHTSTVVSDSSLALCKASQYDNRCGVCRLCWDKSVKNVSYPLH